MKVAIWPNDWVAQVEEHRHAELESRDCILVLRRIFFLNGDQRTEKFQSGPVIGMGSASVSAPSCRARVPGLYPGLGKNFSLKQGSKNRKVKSGPVIGMGSASGSASACGAGA